MFCVNREIERLSLSNKEIHFHTFEGYISTTEAVESVEITTGVNPIFVLF